MDTSPAPSPSPSAPPAAGGEPTVAETMRRVHDQLRRGRAPSFEALLALGTPAAG